MLFTSIIHDRLDTTVGRLDHPTQNAIFSPPSCKKVYVLHKKSKV